VAEKSKKTAREKVSATRKKIRKLSEAELKHFQQMLLEKRREIMLNVSEIEGEALNQPRK
jgi:Fic family protein